MKKIDCLFFLLFFLSTQVQADTLKYNEKRPTRVVGESYNCKSGAGCHVTIDEITAGEAEFTGFEKPVVIVPSYRVKLWFKQNDGGWISTLAEQPGSKVSVTAMATEGSFKFILYGKNKYEKTECVVVAGVSKTCEGLLMCVYELKPVKRIYQYFEVQPVSAVVKGVAFKVNNSPQ